MYLVPISLNFTFRDTHSDVTHSTAVEGTFGIYSQNITRQASFEGTLQFVVFLSIPFFSQVMILYRPFSSVYLHLLDPKLGGYHSTACLFVMESYCTDPTRTCSGRNVP